MNLTLKEIAQALKIPGEFPETMITNIEFDSRQIQAGGLFVPLAGVRDGHEFVTQALENGAVATFWSWTEQNAPTQLVTLPVSDVKAAFQQLAVYYQQKVAPKVLAITGSNGKTTTKDMTAAVMAQRFQTYKTQGNYNNELGMPYTILHMPLETEILILEMGMDHAQEISFLSKLAQPDAAAITMIGEAHLENFDSRFGIAQAKMEITDGLKAGGLLLVPAEEALLNSLLQPEAYEIQTFGLNKAMIQAKILQEEKDQTTFKIQKATFTIPVLGSYNVKNALIAYGFGHYFGLSDEEIGKGLAQFQLTKNRTQWLKAQNGADLLSDIYNANPTAMGLVLDSFAKLTLPGRRLALLADMLELGPESKAMHADMAAHIDLSYAEVFLYGEEMQALAEVLEQQHRVVHHFRKDQKRQLITALKKALQPTDTLLLKGSNGMGLVEVVTQLQAD